MFVNLSNHPSSGWDADQREAALQYGRPIFDVPFPAVPPAADERQIAELAEQVCAAMPGEATHVMVMGEYTLTYELVARLCRRGLRCLAATTRREVLAQSDGRKVIQFRFVRFREYRPSTASVE